MQLNVPTPNVSGVVKILLVAVLIVTTGLGLYILYWNARYELTTLNNANPVLYDKWQHKLIPAWSPEQYQPPRQIRQSGSGDLSAGDAKKPQEFDVEIDKKTGKSRAVPSKKKK